MINNFDYKLDLLIFMNQQYSYFLETPLQPFQFKINSLYY